MRLLLPVLIVLCRTSLLGDPPPNIVEAARAQVGKTVTYDPAYVSLKYPGGDVPQDRGVCTDVVIRAFRASRAFDLQKGHYRWSVTVKAPEKSGPQH